MAFCALPPRTRLRHHRTWMRIRAAVNIASPPPETCTGHLPARLPSSWTIAVKMLILHERLTVARTSVDMEPGRFVSFLKLSPWWYRRNASRNR